MVLYEKSHIVSFISSRTKKITAFVVRFTVKLICCISFGSTSSAWCLLKSIIVFYNFIFSFSNVIALSFLLTRWSKKFLLSIMKLKFSISTSGLKKSVYDVICTMFANGSTTTLFTLRKLGLGKLSKYCLFLLFWFWLILVPVKTVRLNLNFNCFSSFVLAWVDKVTTGTYVFVSFNKIVVSVCVSQMTQFSNQVKIILI